MTIASEITRLQNDKAAICTAIENKGVTVGNVTLDSYASCIDAIEQGGGGKFIDMLVIGGGGAGGVGNGVPAGGGGAGGAIYRKKYYFDKDVATVKIGKGGQCDVRNYRDTSTPYYTRNLSERSGGPTIFGDIIARGGGAGGCLYGYNGGSGGGGGTQGCTSYIMCTTAGIGGYPIICNNVIQGTSGGDRYYNCCCGAGGGGGATSPGDRGGTYRDCCGGNGGRGVCTDITGSVQCFAGGGGGASSISTSCGGFGCYGGGNGGGPKGCPATTCGSGGGGGRCPYNCCGGGSGADGIVVVRYPTDGSYGITCAIGGCKYTCGDYTIHCFVSDGDFIINPTGCSFSYLAVGGGGGGCSGGGGGGEVLLGALTNVQKNTSIVVGAGGCAWTSGQVATDGGDSCLCDIVARGGKAGGYCSTNRGGDGGASGSGYKGVCGGNCRACSGGGGGAGGPGGYCYCQGYCRTCVCDVVFFGGNGLYGYGGGGGGGGCNICTGIDGGGDGNTNMTPATKVNAKNCGGGGGGGYGAGCTGCGGNGVVDICYPSDGSYGFTTATGGDCCYVCGDMCVHRFTSDGTFTIVS